MTTYPGTSTQIPEWVAWTEAVRYRWRNDTVGSTRVSINYYRDYGLYEAVDIPAHDLGWHRFAYGQSWFVGSTMVLRGRFLGSHSQSGRLGSLYI